MVNELVNIVELNINPDAYVICTYITAYPCIYLLFKAITKRFLKSKSKSINKSFKSESKSDE